MSLKEEFQHPSYTSINDIALSCENYFTQFDLVNFAHLRAYKNGEFFFLCSWQDWPRWGFAENRIPPGGFTHYDTLKSGIYFPSMEKDKSIFGWTPEVIIQSREQFGVKHPMMLVKHYGKFYEAFVFDIRADNPHETYLRHIQDIYNFIDVHKDTKRELIQRVSKQLMRVDDQYLNSQTELDSLLTSSKPTPNYYDIFDGSKFTKITTNEFECLKFLAYGSSVKTIARLKNLSPRTIEHTLARLKIKLNCNGKNQLIKLYHENYWERQPCSGIAEAM